MLIKSLKKFETLILESDKGIIEIIIAEKNGNQTVLHVYAPRSIKIKSNFERLDQYLQLESSKPSRSEGYEKNLLKKFANGFGRVDD